MIFVCSDHHCMNERYVFIALSGCFFACTRVVSLLQSGFFHLTFPPVKVCAVLVLGSIHIHTSTCPNVSVCCPSDRLSTQVTPKVIAIFYPKLKLTILTLHFITISSVSCTIYPIFYSELRMGGALANPDDMMKSYILSVVFLKPTVSIRPSVPPSGSHK